MARHRTVRLSEIGAHPWGRMDAGYWLAPDVVRVVMDEKPGRTREQAERVLDRRRRVIDSDDAVRFLLDGLGVDSIAALHAVVEACRWIAFLEENDTYDGGEGPEFYVGRGVAVDAARDALGLD